MNVGCKIRNSWQMAGESYRYKACSAQRDSDACPWDLELRFSPGKLDRNHVESCHGAVDSWTLQICREVATACAQLEDGGARGKQGKL